MGELKPSQKRRAQAILSSRAEYEGSRRAIEPERGNPLNSYLMLLMIVLLIALAGLLIGALP